MIAAAVAGVLVDGFFAIVNFYPVAPHPSRGPKRYIVMQLDDDQAQWFTSTVLADFNDEHDANLDLIRVDDEEQLQATTADAIKQGKDVIAAALPVTQVDDAVANKLVRPFSGVVSSWRIATDFHQLGDDVLASGLANGTQFFLPQMRVVHVAVYRASKVRDAVLHWSALRPQIDAALKRVNGRGLPAGYELELTPSAWDSYDLFVMAYYWAHRSYGGQPARPRVAHRTGDSIDAQRDILGGIYGHGATDATAAAFDSQPARDYFEWEALYRAEGLYPPEMTGGDFDDEAVIDALAHGDVFLAPIDSMEAFDLHGGAHAGALAHADDPGDLEFTSMPHGASLELDAKGHPARAHDSFAFREDWVWAVPVQAKGAEQAYELVKFLWRPEIHARLCEALGMLPTHPEVIAIRASRFRLDWMSDIFDAGLAQEQHGERMRRKLIHQGLGSVYVQLWAKIVGGGIAPAPDTPIGDVLRAPPPAKPLAASITHHTPPRPDASAAPPPELEDWESDAVLEGVQR